MTKFFGPDPSWRNEADCDTINWSRNLTRLVDNDSIAAQIADPSVIQLNCAGPLHVNFRDSDGTLTGKVRSLRRTGGSRRSESLRVLTYSFLRPCSRAARAQTQSILGTFDAKRTFPYDQGTALIPGPCQYSETWKGYSCEPNSTAFELSAPLKPNPVTKGGIFADPQHFVLESRDPDSEDRNFSPVFVNVSGSIELLVSAMDHGWCFAYTCQKRLSTFWTYLPCECAAAAALPAPRLSSRNP